MIYDELLSESNLHISDIEDNGLHNKTEEVKCPYFVPSDGYHAFRKSPGQSVNKPIRVNLTDSYITDDPTGNTYFGYV